MKKCFILLLLSSMYCYSQNPIVHDPGNAIHLVDGLKKAADQIKRIREQTQILQDAKDAVVKVNNNIRQVRGIKRMVEYNANIVTKINNELGSFLRSPNLSEKDIKRTAANAERYLDLANNNLSFLTNLLTDDYFKLSDYERILLIDKKEKEMITLEAELNAEFEALRNTEVINASMQAHNERARKQREKLKELFNSKNK